MRHLRTALACLAAFAAVTVAAVPAEASSAILATKGAFYGQSLVTFQVRAGERYLNVDTSATPAGAVALEIWTATGPVKICMNTKATGPLSVDGLEWVTMKPLVNPACGAPPAVTGTIVAFFSHTSFTLADAWKRAQADPTRTVVLTPAV